MSQYTAKAQAYINYINDLRLFMNIPLWLRQLNGYNSRPPKKVSLSPSTMDDAHKAYNSLPPSQILKYTPLLRNSGYLLLV
jgi:hypothetical protein